MSAFYDQASLVVVPSGYKSGKIYAQKPLTTDGQLTFTRASTATRVNASGLIETVSSGVPRLDYLGSTCPKLLLEPQRSNLALYSEQFNNAAWTGDRYTITANSVASPDGYTNADTFTATNASNSHNINPLTLINLGGVAGTFSVFAKYNGYNLSLSIAGTSTNWTGCVFDLQNGVARTPQTSGAQAVCTSKIEDYGNGWYRCSISYTPYTNGTFYTFIGSVSSATATLDSFGLQSYTANGTSGFYLYGAQIEQGAYATSYIPTTSAAVTRLADAASKTGISSLIGQTEGTIYWEGKVDGLAPFNESLPISLFATGATTSGAQIYVTFLANGRINFVVYDGATVQAQVQTTTSFYTLGTNIKIAAVYKANDFALYINGVQIGTDTSGSVVATSELYLDYKNNVGNYSTSQLLLFKTRLTNAQLAELTTL